MLNIFLPARAGDFYRAYYLGDEKGEKKETVEIPKTGHSYKASIVPPTCLEYEKTVNVKKEILFEAIGEIDDELIERSEKAPTKKRIFIPAFLKAYTVSTFN